MPHQHNQAFKLWLKRNGLNYQTFAQELTDRSGTAIHGPTVVKWAYGARPKPAYVALIRSVRPDCPLVEL